MIRERLLNFNGNTILPVYRTATGVLMNDHGDRVVGFLQDHSANTLRVAEPGGRWLRDGTFVADPPVDDDDDDDEIGSNHSVASMFDPGSRMRKTRHGDYRDPAEAKPNKATDYDPT